MTPRSSPQLAETTAVHAFQRLIRFGSHLGKLLWVAVKRNQPYARYQSVS